MGVLAPHISNRDEAQQVANACRYGPEGERSFAVFVFDRETSTVRHQPVSTAGVRDNDIVVWSGLSEGDILATAGVSFLRDGQTVTLLQDR